MSRKTTRIAIIGCGNMGNYYAHNLSRMDGVKIVSCCDPSQKKLNRFREKWGIPAGTTDWKELIPREGDQSEIDGVINSSVDKLHEEIFQACFSSPLPLLTEKPFAVPFATLKSLSLPKMQEQKFIINFSKRCIPAVASVQRALKQGELGKIHRIELHYRQGWVLNHDYGDWRDTSAWFWRLTEDYSHHGVLGDLGSHLFDLASFLCGSVKTVSCHLSRIDKSCEEFNGHRLDSMDEAHCLLEMQNGAAGLINATRTAAGEKDGLKIMICGEKGSIKVIPEESRDSYRLYLVKTGEWQTVACPESPLKNHEHFMKLIKTENGTDLPGLREALYNHVVIEAAMESTRKGCGINIDSFGEKKLEEVWRKIVQQA